MRKILFAMALASAGCIPAFAQDRPFKTTDVQTVPAGDVRVEAGFDFLQDVGFPVSGLRGDETSIGVLNVRMGISKIAEVEVEGAIQNFLDVKSQGASFVPNLKLTGVNSTHDTGDFALSTKIRFRQPSGKTRPMCLRWLLSKSNCKS